MNNILDIAKEVIEIEFNAVKNLTANLNEDFENIIDKILLCKGKVIITGMGKSGIIGKKIAATLASTGTASFFMHPGEAYHGDLGMVSKEDIVIAISNSGETDEILKIVPFLKDNGNIVISMTGNKKSTLALNSLYHIDISVEKEACPLQLAPTASTTATLVMGDVLAVVLMKRRNFREENFAKFHPGGSLGRKLLTRVKDVMRFDNLPIIGEDEKAINIIHKVSLGRLGLAVVISNDEIKGIVTDGDLRRKMEEKGSEFFNLIAKDMMTKNPKTISGNEKLKDAEILMNENKITSLLVAEEKRLIGIIQIYDIGK